MIIIRKTMNLKTIGILATAITLTTAAQAQTKLSAARQRQVIEKIDRASKATTSIQCDFTQTKSMKMLKRSMTSKGVMYFKRPDKLRWQYTSPYDYTFIMNNGKVSMRSAQSSKNVNTADNKVFSRITNIILGCITGGGLTSTADFNVVVYEKEGLYTAQLYPKKKEMKQIYSVIEIQFNRQLTMVSSVRMKEKTGDETLVKLLNVKTNTQINEKVFDVR